MSSQLVRTLYLHGLDLVDWEGPLSSGATGDTPKWLMADMRRTL